MSECPEEIAPPRVVDRGLTAKEFKLAQRMLTDGSAEAINFLPDLEVARVVSECSCGCGSIDFAIGDVKPEGIGIHILGDFMFGEPFSKDECNVFIFEQGGTLAGIEFVWMHDEAEIRIPEPDELVVCPAGPEP